MELSLADVLKKKYKVNGTRTITLESGAKVTVTYTGLRGKRLELELKKNPQLNGY